MKIIIICGPTGIGKTAFAISCAKQFCAEIVGADSMQIYQHMTIGTAKPDPDELQAVPHHLVDCVDPQVEFDAGMYVRAADQAIAEIVSRNRLPFVVGGTGLYIKALVNGLFRSRAACPDTLNRLTQELAEKGNASLHEKLLQCDPVAGKKIHPNDTFRVVRALEVFETTGQRISDHQTDHGFARQRYHTLKIGLRMDRETLYQRINHRVDLMLDQGLLDEVQALIQNGYDMNLKPMQSIGYRHMGLYLSGRVDWDEAVRLLKRDTRRYAKRQFTWFHRDKDIHWVEPDQDDLAFGLIKEFLTTPGNLHIVSPQT